MHRKGAQDAKRAKLFTKLLRDISIAARENNESKLKTAIEMARKNNVPNKNIEKAMKSQESIGELIRYEGFISGIGIIIETITDNKNRTAAEIRNLFNKYNGNISSTIHLFKIAHAQEFIGSETEVIKHTLSIEADEYIHIEDDKWIIISEYNIGEKIYIPILKIELKETESIEKFIDESYKINEVQGIWTQLG